MRHPEALADDGEERDDGVAARLGGGGQDVEFHADVVDGTAFVGDRQLLPAADQWWYLRNLGIAGVASVALLWVGLKSFDKAEGNFAEIL